MAKQKKKTEKKGKFIDYLDENIKLALTSIKERPKKLILPSVVDIIFYVLIAIVFIAFGSYLVSISAGFPLMQPELLQPEQLEPYDDMFASLIVKVLVSVSILFIVINALTAVAKGTIWQYVLKKKLEVKDYFKLAGLNALMLLLFILVILMLPIKFIDPTSNASLIGYAVFVNLMTLVLLHFSIIVYYKFVSLKKFFTAIKEGFLVGIKVHRFIFPYLLSIVVLFVLGLVTVPLQLLGDVVNLVVSTILLLIFMAWFRFYIAEVIKRVN